MHQDFAQVKSPAGFTLIELIIAIVIVVILTTIGVAGFNSASRANAIQQQAQEIKSLARKLRTDASAAVKPTGTCQTSGAVYGTYITFTSGSSNVTYGTSCWSPTSVAAPGTDYSPATATKSLSSPISISSATQTIFYAFDGGVYFFPTVPTRTDILGASTPASIYKVVITDGTTSRDYQIAFSPTGLVCEERSGSNFCAGG